MNYEELQIQACKDGIEIIEYPFKSSNIKGLYCNGTVALNEDMTQVEKSCVLAEEMGHHYTTVGNILNMESIQNRKQERQARLHGYNRLIGLAGLVEAYEHGCQNRYEIAEFLEIPRSTVQTRLQRGREKLEAYFQ